MRARGFTLIEAAVTLVIAMIVIFAAVNLQVLITRSFTSARRVAELSDRVIGLSSYLSKELATVGGNAAGTAYSIYVEDACAQRGDFPACPNGSDRVTVFAAVSNLPACRISHVDGSDPLMPPRVAFWYRDAAQVPRCCFNDELNGTRDSSGTPTQYLKRHAMLVQGAYHKAVLLIGEAGSPGFGWDPAPSTYTDWDADADGIVDTRCTFRMIDVMEPNKRFEPPTPDGWREGTATIVDMRTLYIDDRVTPPQLILHTDLDANGLGAAPTTTNAGTPGHPAWGWAEPVAPAVDETLVIMDGVYDLQLMLGYDMDPENGKVEGGGEWVHDVPSEARDYAQDRRLRLLRADFVVGVKVGGMFNPRPVPTPARFGGAELLVPAHLLRASSVVVMPRNTDSLLAGVD
jgi:hypothetical protein